MGWFVRWWLIGSGLKTYYQGKLDELELVVQDKQQDLRRLEAQRNDLNTKGSDHNRIPSPPLDRSFQPILILCLLMGLRLQFVNYAMS